MCFPLSKITVFICVCLALIVHAPSIANTGENVTTLPTTSVSVQDYENLKQQLDSMKVDIETFKRYFSNIQQGEATCALKGGGSDISCARKRRCKDDNSGSGCPTGAMKYGRTCFLYVHRNMTWMNASAHCADMTGRMVHVKSKSTTRNIKRFLKAQLGRRGLNKARVYTGLFYTDSTSKERKPFFTGGAGISVSGKADGWYWHALEDVNLTKLRVDKYTNWAEPNRTDEKTRHLIKSCMQLDGSVGMKWVDVHCAEKRRFICEFSAVRKHSSKGKSKEKRKRKQNKRGTKDKGKTEGEE